MSLKTRLRVLIVLLIVTIVVSLSVFNVSSVADAKLDAVAGRSQLTASQVNTLVQQRLLEQSAGMKIAPGDVQQVWTRLIATDPVLKVYLREALSNSAAFVEIAITDNTDAILTSTDAAQIGRRAKSVESFSTWQGQSLWRRLIDLGAGSDDYAVEVPLAQAGHSDRMFTIRVIISAALLERLILPEVYDLSVVSGVSLLISVVLAMLVSNLALAPLAIISSSIDQIAAGQLKPESGTNADEIATVQSKLTQLGQQYRGARQDAAQLRTNIDHMLQRLEEAVLLFDPNGALMMAGRPAERLLGIAHPDLIGRHFEEIFPSWTAQGMALQKALKSRKPLHDVPITLERSGLPTLRLIINLEQVENFPGHGAMGTIVTLRDADTRREIASQLDVSSRLSAINRLTSGVAHEIRNPLNAITLHLHILREKLADHEELIGGEIDVIAGEIARLDRVVKTFLDFTRPVQFRLREVDLCQLTKETITLVEPQAKERAIEIIHESKGEPATIQGDWDSLKQALLNVVINAVEAMEKDGRLSIDVQEVFDECVVVITDSGPGIPPEVQDKIFNLYFTTKKTGTGIGLAVTFQVVQLHSGTIDFTSEAGKGTTFRLRFPSIRQRQQEAQPVG